MHPKRRENRGRTRGGRSERTEGCGRLRTVIGRVGLDGGCEVLRGGVVVARGELLVAGVLGLERGLALLGGDLRWVRGGADGMGPGQTARAGRGRRRSRGGTCWIEAAAAKRRDILRETLRISARRAGRFRRGFSGRRCTHVGGGLLLVVLLGWHGERVGRCVFGVCARLEVIDDAVPPKVLFSSPRISKRMSVSLGVTSPAGPFLMRRRLVIAAIFALSLD